MGKYFNQADVFPIITDLTKKLYQVKRDFVFHEEIVQGLLNDPVGKKLVEFAYQKKNSHSREWWAGNMVAWFSQKITAGEYKPGNEFERKQIHNNYAYKPKAQDAAQQVTQPDLKLGASVI